MKGKPKINSVIVKKVVLYSILLLLLVLATIGIVNSFSPAHVFSMCDKPDELTPAGAYNSYLNKYLDQNDTTLTFNQKLENAKVKDTIITSDATEATFDSTGALETEATTLKSYVYTNASTKVTFPFDVTESGFYNILVEYMPFNSTTTSGNKIERKLYINDEIPFDDVANISFQRIWKDGPIYTSAEIAEAEKEGRELTRFKRDIGDNDIRPSQEEAPAIRNSYIIDPTGYVAEPFLFYLESGSNEVTLESVREEMKIYSISLVSYDRQYSVDDNGQVTIIGSYEDYYNYYANNKNATKVNNNYSLTVQGEDSSLRSDSTLYAISDRTSGATTPHDHVKTRLNSIGGDKWTTPGDWISWDISVEETGFYQISMRSKQSSSRGIYTTRKLLIDGSIPFPEAANCKFNYSNNWNIVTIGDETEPYYFYFEAGKTYNISLENTLGDYGKFISQVQETIDALNSCYLKIISKTSISPDPYQDYDLYDSFPTIGDELGIKDTFIKYAARLRELIKQIADVSGGESDKTASLDTLAVQLEGFIEDERSIQKRLSNFSSNISALGTWIQTVSAQPLTVDWINVHSEDVEMPKANTNFFTGTWYGIVSFFKSFTYDYSQIGATKENQGGRTVEVWFLTSESTGREQANALRALIDSATSKGQLVDREGNDIFIDLKLVNPGVLLSATLAGRGPDVAINVYNGLPMNYAVRGAIYDLMEVNELYEAKYGVGNEFVITKDAEGRDILLIGGETTPRFQASSIVPYKLTTVDKDTKATTDHYYALPNTQSFSIMFYRTDIFDAHDDWTVPETWEDVLLLIPELQNENLQFYLPLNTTGSASVVNGIFASILYQNGGSFYKDGMVESAFDSEAAKFAFETWCQFYTDHSFPLSASFVNRFRTGETPIGIAGYEMYNTLAVSAPEIRGKWSFALIPGTITGVDADGNDIVDHSSGASGTAVVIMNAAEDKEASWEFLKWWTSADIQLGFAKELESILGSAARHNTANIEAFQKLAWTETELKYLMEQWEVSVGVPEVPGGYYTGRNLENAFRKVVNSKLEPRETLEEYVLLINEEITFKRKEFVKLGLPYIEDGVIKYE